MFEGWRWRIYLKYTYLLVRWTKITSIHVFTLSIKIFSILIIDLYEHFKITLIKWLRSSKTSHIAAYLYHRQSFHCSWDYALWIWEDLKDNLSYWLVYFCTLIEVAYGGTISSTLHYLHYVANIHPILIGYNAVHLCCFLFVVD